MSVPILPSARSFRVRHTLANGLPGTVSAGFLVAYLAALLQLDPASQRAFAWSVLAALVVMTPIGQWFERRAQRDIVRALAAETAGALDAERVRAGYRAALRLPVAGLVWQAVCWPIACSITVAMLGVLQGELTPFRSITVLCAGLTCGVMVAPFAYYGLRRLAEPVRAGLAARLSLEEQEALAPIVPLRWKLVAPTAAVALAASVFAALFAYTAALRPVETHDTRIKAAFLRWATPQLASGEHDLTRLRQMARDLEAADELLRFDPSGTQQLAGPPLLTEREREYLVAAATGSSVGHSGEFESRHSFVWRRLAPSQELLLAVTPTAQLADQLRSTHIVFGIVFLVVLGSALAGVGLLVQDVGGTTWGLGAEVARVRAGDLRGGAPRGSDDELGALTRGFGLMTASLRGTLGRVAGAADRVDGAAVLVAQVSASVGGASASQVASLERAAASTASIDRQVAGITTSSEVLTRSVEEASSSVLELGAAAEELHQTAQGLNSQVDEVSSSIEQMMRSVAHVSASTDVLSESALETASSLQEMGRSAVEVDGHAQEGARLSARVVELAEAGRDRMRRSREGMESIRLATDAARGVIRGLSGRVVDIGRVVDVIDDVADETNLLALNAAIIAAQAGEQGRAFSVVADEIKDLAERVLASTKEIEALIGSVQEESARAEQAIEVGTARVREGVEFSESVGAALEEITGAAHDCGTRTQEIVHVLVDHARATRHAGELMERVTDRVDEIRTAAGEQVSAHQVVMRSTARMRDAAHQTQRTAEEQARGSARIRDGMEAVCEVVERIHVALREQSQACRSAVSFLEQVHERTRSHDASARSLGEATQVLEREARALRTELQRFQFDEIDA